MTSNNTITRQISNAVSDVDHVDSDTVTFDPPDVSDGSTIDRDEFIVIFDLDYVKPIIKGQPASQLRAILDGVGTRQNPNITRDDFEFVMSSVCQSEKGESLGSMIEFDFSIRSAENDIQIRAVFLSEDGNSPLFTEADSDILPSESTRGAQQQRRSVDFWSSQFLQESDSGTSIMQEMVEPSIPPFLNDDGLDDVTEARITAQQAAQLDCFDLIHAATVSDQESTDKLYGDDNEASDLMELLNRINIERQVVRPVDHSVQDRVMEQSDHSHLTRFATSDDDERGTAESEYNVDVAHLDGIDIDVVEGIEKMQTVECPVDGCSQQLLPNHSSIYDHCLDEHGFWDEQYIDDIEGESDVEF